MKSNPKPLNRIVAGSLIALGCLGAGGSMGWLWWQTANSPVQATAQPASPLVQIQVEPGSSADAIGQQLHQAGLIRSLTAWKLQARWSDLWDRSGGFQAGTYALSPQESLSDIAEKIRIGQVVQTSFTIPEGWSMGQMAAYFEQQGWFSAAAFLQAAQQIPRDRYPWLPANLPLLEGFLYPDTYQVPQEQRTPAAVIDLMLDRFQSVALPLYQTQTTPHQSLLDWVTLASIVEKEAVVPQERPLIAGVFWNRLQQGMALGADPTVEYGLGVKQTEDQPLTLDQVQTPSPYNTYLNPGLPPTPIASPGLASLKAALQPMSTDYLYFMARYDGTHIFSRTLAEHEQAQAMVRDQQEAKQDGQPATRSF